jgi:hypothetical protein
MNRLTRIVLPALAILAAGAAQAQTVPSPFRYVETRNALEVTGGYLFLNPDLELSDTTSAEFGPRSAPSAMLRYQRRFGGPLSGMIGVGFSPSERKVISAAEGQDSAFVQALETGETVSAPILMAEAGLRLHLTGDRTFRGMAPYLSAMGGLVSEVGGTGEEEALPERERFDFGPAIALGAGAGLDVFLTRRASLQTELTYRLWRMSVPQGFGVLERDRGRWVGQGGVSVGAAFHF